MIVALAALLALAPAGAGEPVAGSSAPDWPDPDQALPSAVEAGEAFLIEFYRDSCRYCSDLWRDVYPHPDVAPFLGEVRRTRVDIGAIERGGFAARFSLLRTPTLVVLDPSGRTLDRVDGLPSPERLRALIEVARRAKPGVPADALAWIGTGDLALDAGATDFAAECYRRAMTWPQVDPRLSEGARLQLGRALVRAGDHRGAAEVLELFAASVRPGPACRPALEELIRARDLLGDPEGGRRARESFARLFPNLPAPP